MTIYNGRELNVKKGEKGFQETERSAPSSDANLGDTSIFERDQNEAFPEDQDLFEYQSAYRNALRVEFPDEDADLIDDQVMSNAYGNYYRAVNQLAREGQPITQTMLADLNEPNRRYLEQNYGELIESTSSAHVDNMDASVKHRPAERHTKMSDKELADRFAAAEIEDTRREASGYWDEVDPLTGKAYDSRIGGNDILYGDGTAGSDPREHVSPRWEAAEDGVPWGKSTDDND